jgi:hypothetical protein
MIWFQTSFFIFLSFTRISQIYSDYSFRGFPHLIVIQYQLYYRYFPQMIPPSSDIKWQIFSLYFSSIFSYLCWFFSRIILFLKLPGKQVMGTTNFHQSRTSKKFYSSLIGSYCWIVEFSGSHYLHPRYYLHKISMFYLKMLGKC